MGTVKTQISLHFCASHKSRRHSKILFETIRLGTVIYLPFGSAESKGLTGLIFNESQDKIKSPIHIFEQFSIVFCEFRDSHVYIL